MQIRIAPRAEGGAYFHVTIDGYALEKLVKQWGMKGLGVPVELKVSDFVDGGVLTIEVKED
jgi:hypothetical protein